MKLGKKILAAMTGLLMSAPLLAADPADQQTQAQKVLSDLHQANQMEIQMGRMAKEKGSSQQVKDYGDKLVKDHSDADKQVQDLAQKDGFTLLAVSTEGVMDRYTNDKEQKTMADLSKKTGADFDKAFAEAMVDDHNRDISKLKKAEDSLQQPDVKNLVAKLLPTLQEHLQIAQQIEKSS